MVWIEVLYFQISATLNRVLRKSSPTNRAGATTGCSPTAWRVSVPGSLCEVGHRLDRNVLIRLTREPDSQVMPAPPGKS